MPSGAGVYDFDALDQFRVAMLLFREEALQALDEAALHAAKTTEWLKGEQVNHWRAEIRAREDRLVEAKLDLHRARSATIDPQHTPSCLQEQKAVERALRELDVARAALEAVRRWIPVVERAADEFRTHIAPLVNDLNSENARWAMFLRHLVQRLHEYLDIQVPQAESGGTSSPACSLLPGTVGVPGRNAERSNNGTPDAAARGENHEPS